MYLFLLMALPCFAGSKVTVRNHSGVNKIVDFFSKFDKIILRITVYSKLPNKRVNQNKQVWREDILIYYMKVLGKSFSFVTHEKWKVIVCEK